MSWNPTHLQVAVQRARNLIAKGKSGTNDVFVTVSLGKEKFHTTTKEKAADPEWYEECDMILPEKYEESRIEIVVSHRNALGMDEFLGRLELPLRNYNIHDPPKSQWYALLPKPGHTKNFKRGEIEVRLCYIVAKVKDPDSISTASSASKRLKIGKKMLSSLGEKLHMKKKDKIRDHIPDLTGLDEGVLDDDDIAENYSTALKVSRKASDSSSRHDEKPLSSAQSLTFTKFTPFPNDKSDKRSPSSSIASEEDLAHKHGDAGSENSLEMGHEKPGRGLTRLSGGKLKKLSLGKRGLTSKDKSQSVWEISNTKSEFGLSAGLKLTVHSSKEEGDIAGSKRPLAGVTKDLENVADISTRAEDRTLGSHTLSSVAPGNVNKPDTGSLASSAAGRPSAASHDSMAQIGGSHKIGTFKPELKQTPVLVDDDDDSDYHHSTSDLVPTVSSSAVNVKRDVSITVSRLSDDLALTAADHGRELAVRANEADTRVTSTITRKDNAFLDSSGSLTIESSPTGLPITTALQGSSVVPAHTQAASKITKKDASLDASSSLIIESRSTSLPISTPTRDTSVISTVANTTAAATVPDSTTSNPFLSSSADVRPNKTTSNFKMHDREVTVSADKPRLTNPFEDSSTHATAGSVAAGNPFEEEDSATAGERANIVTSHELPVTNVPKVAVVANDAPRALNPFEENAEDGKGENANGNHTLEPQQTRALDPPTIETFTIPTVNDSTIRMVVTESATKAIKTSSRKVLAPTAPREFRQPEQPVATPDHALPAVVTLAGAASAATPAVSTGTSAATPTRGFTATPTPVALPAMSKDAVPAAVTVAAPATVIAARISTVAASDAAKSTPRNEAMTTVAHSDFAATSITTRSAIETSTSTVNSSLSTTRESSSPVIKYRNNNNPFEEEDNQERNQAEENAANVSLALSNHSNNTLPATVAGATSSSATAMLRDTIASTSAKVTARPAPASTIAAAAIASARAALAPAERPQTTNASVPPGASPKGLPSATAIGEAAVDRSVVPKETAPAIHPQIDEVGGKSTAEQLSGSNKLLSGADARVMTNMSGEKNFEQSAVSSSVNKTTVGAQKSAANVVANQTSVTGSSSKNAERAAVTKQDSLTSNATSANGLVKNVIASEYSVTSAVTFQDQSASTPASAESAVDSATQTQTSESQESIPPEFKNISKEVLVEMVLKMKAQLAAKEGQVRDLEEYIDRLLVRVMDGNPALLLHTDPSMKRATGKP